VTQQALEELHACAGALFESIFHLVFDGLRGGDTVQERVIAILKTLDFSVRESHHALRLGMMLAKDEAP
jgi:hypothetical protein